ncbi:MAG: cysteine desulfurase family protein [Sphingomonadales bacterium]
MITLNKKMNIYLDHNATSPTRPEAIEAMYEMMKLGGNPSSVHSHGRMARQKLDKARMQVATFVGARAKDVIFTSGGTEANNIALRSSGAKRLIILQSEHDSIKAASVDFYGEVVTLPVDQNGLVIIEDLIEALVDKGEGTLVSIMLANNETGVIHPIKELSKLVHSFGAKIHTDAVQAAGKIPFSFEDLGVDLLSISSHKITGPQGVGALVLKHNIFLKPLMVGGGQEEGRRPGTENLPGIVGFGIAAKLASEDLLKYKKIQLMRDKLVKKIITLSPSSRVFGLDTERLPNTLSITMPGIIGETQVMAFDLEGISVSAGSACTSGKVKASHVLLSMLDGEEAGEAIRVSMGKDTTQEEINQFYDTWKSIFIRTHNNR